MKHLRPCVLLAALICVASSVFASIGDILHISSFPKEGLVLSGWKFHPGDDISRASPRYDDSDWQQIDPGTHVQDLDLLTQFGSGWLRLEIVIDSVLRNKQLAVSIEQYTATEIYLDGKRVAAYGQLPSARNRTSAWLPSTRPFILPLNPGRHVIAVRIAYQPGIPYLEALFIPLPAFRMTVNTYPAALLSYAGRQEYLKAMFLVFGGMCGAYGIVALTCLSYFLYDRRQKGNLYYFIFCGIIAIQCVFCIPYYDYEGAIAWLNWVTFGFGICFTVAYLALTQTVYSLFGYRNRKMMLALILIGIPPIILQLFYGLFPYILTSVVIPALYALEAARVSYIALKQKKKGAEVVLAGVIMYLILFNLGAFLDQQSVFVVIMQLTGVLCFPLGMAIYLGIQNAMTNSQLRKSLANEQTLSAENLVREQEKQQLLSEQNLFLEQKVAERTSELAGKNRDLGIEAALERVRATAIAMHHSDELLNVITVVGMELEKLGINFDSTNFRVNEGETDWDLWIYAKWLTGPQRWYIPYLDHPYFRTSNVDGGISTHVFSRQDKDSFDDYLLRLGLISIPDDPEARAIQQSYADAATGFAWSIARVNSISLNVANSRCEPYSDAENAILLRFAASFEQAYTRFLDLKKAEALTRESQIELGLERVRSRAMAMQNSDELTLLIGTVFTELTKLDLILTRCVIMIFDPETKAARWWLSNPEAPAMPESFLIPYNNQLFHLNHLQGWKDRQIRWQYILAGAEKIEWDEFLFKQTDLARLPEPVIQGMRAESAVVINASFNNFGCLSAGTHEALSGEHADILLRFAKVFDLTYTRFNDLKQAEAQTERAKVDLIKLVAEKQRTEDALSELKVTQSQLIQAEKMASLGELTAGIAHEIQNPLNFVNNFSEVSIELLDELKEEAEAGNKADVIAIADDLQQNLGKINVHGKRADNIVKGMLQHSRTSVGQKEPTDLNALAEEYLRLSYQGIRAKYKMFNVELVTNLDPALPRINVVPQDLGRVFLNLFNNSFQAVQERARNDKMDYSPKVEVRTQETAGNILIIITDNGPGIPSLIRDKIFQPFFTTKPTGEGTGLGLSLSYDIVVKGYNGTLEVRSEEGGFTEFIVSLSK